LSEATEGVQEEEEGSITKTGIAIMTVIAVLAVALGLMTVGFIPTLGGAKAHTTSTRGGNVQFITVTSTQPPITNTVTSTGTNHTVLSVITATTTTQGANVTMTQTSTATQIVTNVTTSTTTVQQIILQPTTTTTTQTITSTTTVAPTDPLTVNVTMDPPANPASLYAGEHFTIGVAVHSLVSYANLTIIAYQVSSLNTPQVLSFYPLVPESVAPVVGNSYYVVEGNVSQTAPVGDYQMVVQVQATSPGITVNSVSQQYLVHLLEPLTFNGYRFVNTTSTSNFSGSCTPSTLSYSGNTNWYWKCAITAAPNATGKIIFNVTNSANVPICISTALQSPTMTGFVNMNPYPFCPDGAPGVYVPANVTNWSFTYTVENGNVAGLQTVYFLFERTTGF
jgi:hypothetical protein